MRLKNEIAVPHKTMETNMNIKIVPDSQARQEVKSIEDYAAYIGFCDAALRKPRRENVFTFGNKASQLARLIYELSYDLEQETNLLYLTSEFEVEAFVKTWDENHGIGYLEFVDQGQIKNVFFSYRELNGDEWDITGMVMKVKFKYKSDGLIATEVVPL